MKAQPGAHGEAPRQAVVVQGPAGGNQPDQLAIGLHANDRLGDPHPRGDVAGIGRIERRDLPGGYDIELALVGAGRRGCQPGASQRCANQECEGAAEHGTLQGTRLAR